MKIFLFSLIIFALFSCKEDLKNEERIENNVIAIKKDFKLPNYKELMLLDKPLPEVKSGDWLSQHDENGQSFQQYCKKNTLIFPSKNNNIIYIQPIGSFTMMEKKIIDWNTTYIELFFGLKTIQLPALSEEKIPENKKRIYYGIQQLDAGYIINSVLPKNIPEDGIVIMALTAKDLYPDPQWNYVFGLASYQKRTGVSSIYRYSEETLNEHNYQQCLKRIIKTSTHEISHMFSLAHCIHAVCLMNGANNLREADSHPNSLCSECLTKLSWNLNFKNVNRLNRLITFMNVHHLKDDAIILSEQKAIIQK